MPKRINYKLYRGSINKFMSVTYTYTFETEGKFSTIYQPEHGNSVTISPTFGISISNGFEKDQVYIPAHQYYHFTALLETAVKLISEHLYELFPNVGKMEFEINAKTLERFMTEKSVASNGITIVPCMYVDETNQCYPGIHITSTNLGNIKIPLQDAIPISKMLMSLQPHELGISMLRIMGHIE